MKPLTMTHISSKKVITGDESWVYGYDPETKAQSSQWKSPESPRPKKARQSRSNVKVILTLLSEHEGVVHHEYAPPGQTITKDYYIEVFRRLRDAVRRKRQQLWASGDWLLHHENAPAYSSALVQTFLVKHGITQVCLTLISIPNSLRLHAPLTVVPTSHLYLHGRGQRKSNAGLTPHPSSSGSCQYFTRPLTSTASSIYLEVWSIFTRVQSPRTMG